MSSYSPHSIIHLNCTISDTAMHAHLFSSQPPPVPPQPFTTSALSKKSTGESSTAEGRMHLLMKEQLDIAVNTLKQQMANVIRQQAQEYKHCRGCWPGTAM